MNSLETHYFIPIKPILFTITIITSSGVVYPSYNSTFNVVPFFLCVGDKCSNGFICGMFVYTYMDPTKKGVPFK